MKSPVRRAAAAALVDLCVIADHGNIMLHDVAFSAVFISLFR